MTDDFREAYTQEERAQIDKLKAEVAALKVKIMNDKNLREHGYPDMGDTPAGTPTAEPTGKDNPCPNCGCHLMMITVAMKNPLVKGGNGIGRYLGCPACPFASPMVTRPA